jgi:Tfp pilus assembly protein PilX
MYKKIELKQDQSGVATIIVTMLIMVILGLIILGFARVVNREQIQVTDRQLNTQAFYAAESGVNNMVYQLGLNPTMADTTTCTPTEIAPGSGISYSCVLTDTSPTMYNLDNVGINDSVVIPIQRKDGSNVTTVSIGWEDKDGGTSTVGCPSSGTLPANWSGSCSPGMLRIDLVPVPLGPVVRAALAGQATTIFAQPVSGGSGSVSIAGLGGNATRAVGNCSTPITVGSTPKHCDLTINMPGAGTYYMRLRSIYKPAKVSLCTPDCNAGAKEMIGFQAIIDSTGKAADILRRIQVRAPINKLSSQSFPSNSLESGASICKRLGIIRPTPPTLPNGAIRRDPVASIPACDI